MCKSCGCNCGKPNCKGACKTGKYSVAKKPSTTRATSKRGKK